jgi:uncharacterized protein (TIGR02444 family)
MTIFSIDAINSSDLSLSDNPFWQYSLIVYKQPHCAEFLLSAQNRYGLDVNMLLFIGWLALQKKTLTLSPIFVNSIADFQVKTVQPIRKIRITAKGFNNLKFYNALKKLELTAECIEQQRLYQLSDRMPVSNECLEVTIEQGVKVYISQNDNRIGLIQENNWLQTLIQYLQPDN